MSYWFTPADILSYDALLNFVVGSRGGGKTFNTATHCINAAIKSNYKSEWVYMRRTEAELDECKDTYFDAINSKNIFQDVELSVSGRKGYVNGHCVCHFLALSTARKLKSVSFPNVKYIIFDEFIIDDKRKGSYLKNEPELFLSIIETILRMRDGKILLLANAATIINPYFDYFGFKPKRGSKFTKHPDPDMSMVIQMWAHPDYVAAKKDTKFGRMTSKLQYGKYMIENHFLLDDYTFVEPMNGKAIYQFSLIAGKHGYGVYYLPDQAIIHVNENYNPEYKIRFAFSIDDHATNVILYKTARQNPHMKRLNDFLQYGRVRFGSLKTKNIVLDILDYL